MNDAESGHKPLPRSRSESARVATNASACRIRRALPGDLDVLLRLCSEHASHEGAGPGLIVNRQVLAQALFCTPPRLHAWVAESFDGSVVGYVTASAGFSTWQAAEFLHMDCLYLREGWRGAGTGAAMLDVLVDFARREGFEEIQWQTPAWNVDAARFYRRRGAEEKSKRRFFLRVDQAAFEHGSASRADRGDAIETDD